MVIILWVNISDFWFSLQRNPLDMSECLDCHDWVSFHFFVMEHLNKCNDWISWLNLINPIPLFNLITSILWFDLISPISWYHFISLIYLLYLITLTRLLFPSPPHGRWWNMPPISFRIIWLVRPRYCAKYTSMVYLYITGSFN